MFCGIANRGIVRDVMAKVLTAEYDATEKVLRLEKALDGFEDHAKVHVTVEKPRPDDDVERPWMKFSGSLSQEAGESLARAYEEMFGESSEED